MANLNSISIIGNLGKDPRFINDGGDDERKAFVSLAVGVSVYDPKEEDKTRTIWLDVLVFGKRAIWVGENLQKGDKIAVSGSLDIRKSTNKDDKTYINVSIRANDIHPLSGSRGKGGSDGHRKSTRREKETDYGEESGGKEAEEFEL